MLLAWQSRRKPLMPLALISIFAGVGSFALHATASYLGAIIDLVSMNFVVIFVLVFDLARWWGWKGSKTALAFWGLNVLALAFMVVFRSWNLAPFVGAIVLSIILEWRLRHHVHKKVMYWPLEMVFITFFVAFGLWILDSTHLVCDPDDHIFQLHALWHVLNAVAVIFLYLYFAQFVKISKK